jgi:hypothetical protein
VVRGVVLAAGTIGVLGSLLAGRLIPPGNGFTPAHGYPSLSLGDGPTLGGTAGSVPYLALIALGAASAVRDPQQPSQSCSACSTSSRSSPRWSETHTGSGPTTSARTPPE